MYCKMLFNKLIGLQCLIVYNIINKNYKKCVLRSNLLCSVIIAVWICDSVILIRGSAVSRILDARRSLFQEGFTHRLYGFTNPLGYSNF